MKTFPSLIAEVCKTEKTIELVSKAIPVLIRWAQSGITTNTYGDLSQEIGRPRTFMYIGKVLGKVETVLKQLRKKLGQDKIPSLNALVKKTGTSDLPSDGFDCVKNCLASLVKIKGIQIPYLQVLYNAAWEMGKQRYFGRDSFK